MSRRDVYLVPERTGFGKLWKLIMPFSRTRNVLEKRGFSMRLGRSFGFLFRKILQYPKIYII